MEQIKREDKMSGIIIFVACGIIAIYLIIKTQMDVR